MYLAVTLLLMALCLHVSGELPSSSSVVMRRTSCSQGRGRWTAPQAPHQALSPSLGPGRLIVAVRFSTLPRLTLRDPDFLSTAARLLLYQFLLSLPSLHMSQALPFPLRFNATLAPTC